MTQPPAVRQVTAADVRDELDEITDDVGGRRSRVLIEGTSAAIVSADDLRYLDYLDRQRERVFELASDLSSAFADVPTEELEAEVDKAVAEVRAQTLAGRRSR